MRRLLVFVTVSAIAGCSSELTRFSDSRGVTYERVGEDWEPRGDNPPALACTELDAPATEGEWFISGDHVVSICVLDSTGSVDFPSCRVVACDDGRCPSDPTFPIPCEDGICVRPELDWTSTDVIAVCMRDVARFTACEDSAASFAYLDQALATTNDHCTGSACTRPASCL
jgi:hypothetical protein